MSEWSSSYSEGMPLRDYFAAHAPSDLCQLNDLQDSELLIGWKEPADVIQHIKWNAAVEAALRYIYADEMLNRSKKAPQ